MAETRTPLGSLASAVNVGGREYLRRRVIERERQWNVTPCVCMREEKKHGAP